VASSSPQSISVNGNNRDDLSSLLLPMLVDPIYLKDLYLSQIKLGLKMPLQKKIFLRHPPEKEDPRLISQYLTVALGNNTLKNMDKCNERNA
jgi:hypothetical protein